MSILIKGLKVPFSCHECLYESDIYTCKALELTYGNLKNDHKCTDYGKREDCPIIDIPDEFKGSSKSEPANAWWDGYRAAEKIKMEEKSNNFKVRQSDYNDGFDNGYEAGSKDAWEDARKIALNIDDGGYSTQDIIKMFDCTYYQVFKSWDIEDVHQILDWYFEQKAEEKKVKSENEQIPKITTNGPNVSIQYPYSNDYGYCPERLSCGICKSSGKECQKMPSIFTCASSSL